MRREEIPTDRITVENVAIHFENSNQSLHLNVGSKFFCRLNLFKFEGCCHVTCEQLPIKVQGIAVSFQTNLLIHSQGLWPILRNLMGIYFANSHGIVTLNNVLRLKTMPVNLLRKRSLSSWLDASKPFGVQMQKLFNVCLYLLRCIGMQKIFSQVQ